MSITVAEARLLKNSVANKLQRLIDERHEIAYIEFEKGETYTPYTRSFDEVTKEIEIVRSHLRKVKEEITKANLNATIEFESQEVSLLDALELVKQLRNEASWLEGYGKSHEIERVRSLYDNTTLYKKALFNPSEMKSESSEVLRNANRLSILIDKSNFETMVDIPFANEYQ